MTAEQAPRPYRVQIRASVLRTITAWNLPDVILVEVFLRLRETLPQSPTTHLERLRRPFDGMVYRFALIDPENRLCEHRFFFHIWYGQDEETLAVYQGAYQRRVGM